MLVLGLFLPFWLWGVLEQGMFVDGLTYASISRNMSEGLGSFWHPYYWNDQFYGHPPLFFAIESVLFQIFGDTIAVEKGFSIFLQLGIFASFFPIFRWINPKLDRWLIAGSWAILPLVSWAAGAHILDTPLTLTTLWAVGLAFHPNRKKMWWPALASGLLIALSVGIKGPVGLFPFLVFLLKKEETKCHIKFFSGQIFGLLVVAIPVFINENAQTFFHHYFQIQVLGSMEESHRLDFFIQGMQVFLPFVVFRILVARSWRIPQIVWQNWGRILLVAAPLLLSGKQHDYYWLPFLPWMALATFSDGIRGEFSSRFYQGTWILFLMIGLEIWWHAGERDRDREQILAMEKFEKLLPDGSLVGHQPPLDQDWVWIAYGIRYHHWWNRGMEDVRYFFSLDSTGALASSGKYHLKKVPLRDE